MIRREDKASGLGFPCGSVNLCLGLESVAWRGWSAAPEEDVSLPEPSVSSGDAPSVSGAEAEVSAKLTEDGTWGGEAGAAALGAGSPCPDPGVTQALAAPRPRLVVCPCCAL